MTHFVVKIAKFCILSLLIGELFFVSGDPDYYIDLMMHTKSPSDEYHVEKLFKKINLVSKQVYQNLKREASKFNDTRYS